MMEIFLKIWFFVVITPYLMLIDAIARINKALKNRGVNHEVDLMQAYVVLLILLVIVLYANGFRW